MTESKVTEPTTSEVKWLCRWLVFTTLVFVAFIAFSVSYERRTDADLNALLLGRNDVRLTGLMIESQQRRVVCTDHEVLDYLASSLGNSHDDWGVGGGVSYRFSFQLSTGRTSHLDGYIQRQSWSLVVPNANSQAGEPTHVMFLHATPPDRVREMFEFLNKRYQEVSGTVLTLETNQVPRYEYLASLDLEWRRK